VLWHGFSLNFPTLGEADMALLPVAGLGRVDVQHGPSAALYGSGAMGGAVVLGQTAVAKGTQVSGLAEVGSFGSRAFNISGSQRDARVTVRTSFLTRSADNDFAYLVRDFRGETRQRQENAALQQLSFMQDVTVQTGGRSEVQASAWATSANRQIQPAIGSANSHAREQDESLRLLLEYRHHGTRNETAVRAARFYDGIFYKDDNTRTSHSRTQVWQAQAEHTWQWRPNLSLRLGGEAQHFVANVDGYRRPITESRFAGFGLLRYDPSARLRLTLNARQAAIPNRQPPLAPTFGAEWQAWRTARQQLWLKGNLARSYRAPTLNERYWQPGGKPDLRPETGFGYDGGLRYEGTIGQQHAVAVTAELTGFHLLVDDWVQWLPGPTGSYEPQNLRQVRSQGLEASTQAQWRGAQYRLTSRLSYAYTQTQKRQGYAADFDPVGKQLAYVPLHAAAFSTDHSWHNWLLTTTLTYTGSRYLTAAATDYLPAYWLLNASAGYTLRVQRWRLTALVQGYNLTNTSYQNYGYRAMPLRSGSLSLRVAWQ
jgi:iron complex outermembrane receptor protein